jgi:hypothetical protein
MGGKGGGGIRGGEMSQALYAHMNKKKRIKDRKLQQGKSKKDVCQKAKVKGCP